MDRDRIAQLTDRQRLCLRLVYAHLTSKEIAAHLDMEPASIDQDVKSAVRVLGARDRRDAAQMLAEYEKSDDSQPPIDPLSGTAFGLEPDMVAQSMGDTWRRARRGSAEVGEEKATPDSANPGKWPKLVLPIAGVAPEKLGWRTRLAWIAAIAIGIAITVSALVSTLEVLTRVIR